MDMVKSARLSAPGCYSSDRGDWIDGLANAARADRQFPRDGDVGQVRSRLNMMGADGDAFAALDDAELDWLSY